MRIALYDALGRRVASLAPRWTDAGPLELNWNAPKLAPGVYRLRLRAGEEAVETRVVGL